jgi:hypothetical protein
VAFKSLSTILSDSLMKTCSLTLPPAKNELDEFLKEELGDDAKHFTSDGS